MRPCRIGVAGRARESALEVVESVPIAGICAPERHPDRQGGTVLSEPSRARLPDASGPTYRALRTNRSQWAHERLDIRTTRPTSPVKTTTQWLGRSVEQVRQRHKLQS